MTRALIPLPDKQIAPGIRDGIRQRGDWLLEEVVEGFGSVAPSEGAGKVAPYFKITKLCDSKTRLSAKTWQPLVKYPALVPQDVDPRTRPGGDPDPDWRQAMHSHADKLDESGRPGGDLAAVSATILALEPQDVPAYLQSQAPGLFENHSDGSLWFFQTDELLSRRIGLIRVLLAFELLPDYPDVLQQLKAAGRDDHPQIQTLQEHTLTHGFQFDCLVEPILLSIPPAALGYVFPWSPHALVFLFGRPASLVVPQPVSFASLYAPGIQRGEFGDHWDSDFFEGIDHGQIGSLLQWWVSRLNVIYSHATDPTAFADPTTSHTLPSQMTAWLLTFERMLADMLAIVSMPQGAPITRLAMAFDLLDKAESLLGYRKRRSGDGTKRLLNRTEMVRRLDRIWEERLPLQLQGRFKRHTRKLYDQFYERVKAEAYEYRLHGKGIKVWARDTQSLRQWSWDAYVPALVREVRNSSHGLLEALDSADRGVIESHSGQLPAELPDLACLIALALVADAESLCAGTWLKERTRAS
jgi:hypothetical protein